MTRRDWLLASFAPPRIFRDTGNAFPLGVASGDPTASGVVLWTRLMPPVPDPVKVRWAIAEDERMQRVVKRGEVVARAEAAHSVHVDVEGLRPGRWYWYRFSLERGGSESQVGRTRTAPAVEASPGRWRFAVASCQKWQDGFFTAFSRMAEEPDLDAVLHTGDYIYETGSQPGKARHHDLGTATRLDEYRMRYSLYMSDPELQRAHALWPWIVTWDDHEAADNYAGLIPDWDSPRETFAQRRAEAYQAYFEHMPVRAAFRRSRQVRRRLRWGALADLHVLDTRQFRSDQACGDRKKPPCAEWADAARTMLGAEQERWLLDGLAASRAVWNALAQQVIFARFDLAPGEPELYSMDKWDGYPAARERVLARFAELRRTKPAFAPVVLSGDNHNHWAFSLEHDGRRVGFEFAGTSITSGADGSDVNEEYGAALRANEHLLFHSGRRWYLVCDVDAQRWETRYLTLPYVSRPGAPARTAATFRLEPRTLEVENS